jgi:hypothetical protein
VLISHKNLDHLDRADAQKWFILLQKVTSIDSFIFKYREEVRYASAAYKFSWMAGRSTTHVEDEAYCLLGLLDINMPLLYGEGNKAFIRLQEAVLSGSDDISLLAWGYNLPYTHNDSVLARSPSLFLGFPRQDMRHNRPRSGVHNTLTGRGLHIELLMALIDTRNKVWLGVVKEEMYDFAGVGIILRQILGGTGNLFARAGGCPPVPIPPRSWSKRLAWTTKRRQIYILNNDGNPWYYVLSSSWKDILPSFLGGSRPSTSGTTISIPFIRETEYSFSSSWPPVLYSLSNLDEEPSTIGIGSHSHTVYMIFSNDKQDRFAVRLSLRLHMYHPISVETAFCVISRRYVATAFEHCRGTKIGSKVPQFAKDMDWRPYLAMKNLHTNENGHLYASHEGMFIGSTFINCQLVWKEGLYSGEESRWALPTGGL